MNNISVPIAYFVEIRSDKGARSAYGQDLAQTADRPMAVLTRRGKQRSCPIIDPAKANFLKRLRADWLK